MLVGITNVAAVEGYEIKDGQKIAVDGELFYRGISVGEMIENFQKENRFGFEETIFLLLFGSLPSRRASMHLKSFSEKTAVFRATSPRMCFSSFQAKT